MQLEKELIKNVMTYLAYNYDGEEPVLSRSFQEYHKVSMAAEEWAPYDKTEKIKQQIEANAENTFSRRLEALMEERNITPVAFYKSIKLDKRLFSKIISNKYYKPSKKTAVLCVLALKLNEEEADELLNAAGLALSSGYIPDVIIIYCLQKAIYDLEVINSLLAEFGQNKLW